MNAFLEHGESVARRPWPKKQKIVDVALSPLEKRMEEHRQLSRAYRRRKRQETRATLASEPRLRDFLRYLKTVDAAKGEELIQELADCDWLCGAQLDVRLFALRMIDARCGKINRSLGFEAMDDPIPPESSIYFRCRDILHQGGRL